MMKNNLFKQEVDHLIESNLKTYRDNPDRFVADFNREVELTKEYNGRQILELLQNADDAKATSVEITVNKRAKTFSISNRGEEFSSGGIKSLMLANLSTKTKTSYIGNKGLGFRSVINWAQEINIFTNGCKVTFSAAIAESVFSKDLGLTESNIQQLRIERSLSAEAVPFPILGIPIIEMYDSNGVWTTTIELVYREEFEADIMKQLEELKEEVLLFLNHITSVTVKEDGRPVTTFQSLKKKSETFDEVKIQNKTWRVFALEEALPINFQDKLSTEPQFFSLKVALQNDLGDRYGKLFTFFPTKLNISLPCLIHGTFELNSSRNHLNELPKNAYILKQLIRLLKQCSEVLCADGVDWRAYRLLLPENEASDSRLIEQFYEDLEKLRNTAKIYPNIAGYYNFLKEIAYYDDEFQEFFLKHFPNSFPEMVLPIGKTLRLTAHEYPREVLRSRLNVISGTISDVVVRTRLIALLAKALGNSTDKDRFSLLVNGQGEVIDETVVSFTPVKTMQKFHIPSFVNVDFIDDELFDLLFKHFEKEYDKGERDKRRELQRIIKGVVNLQPYDSNNVVDKVVSGTREALKDITSIEERTKCVKQMVTALYANFMFIENRQEKLKVPVPLLSRSGEVQQSEQLFLGSSFSSGILTEVIYEGVLGRDEYLLDAQHWNLSPDEPDLIESFFLWLGVNKYSITTKFQLLHAAEARAYLPILFQNGLEIPSNFEQGRISKETTLTKLVNFRQVSKLSPTRLILLVLKDHVLRNLIETNDEKISWHYVTTRPAFAATLSYVNFQLRSINLFTSYVLEDVGEDVAALINENVQLDFSFLKKYNIERSEVKSILVKLGAKESFKDLSPMEVYDIIRKVPGRDLLKTGRGTQSLYKLALESLTQHEVEDEVPEDLLFFARTGSIESYLPAQQLFYADNAVLPQKILSTLSLLNMPRRVGADNVAKYFGVRNLNEFRVEVRRETLSLNSVNSNFAAYFELLKPVLLAYRLYSPSLRKRISEEGKRREDEAAAIRSCNITIADNCFFDFQDNRNAELGTREYINAGNDFFYREVQVGSIDQLRADSTFCDAFAEMICITFKINDIKNEFRHIVRNDYQDVLHLAKNDLGIEKLEEASVLLGMPKVEKSFWDNVILQNNLPKVQETTSILELRGLMRTVFQIPEWIDLQKVDFDQFNTKESYQLLKELNSRWRIDLRVLSDGGLSLYHRKKIMDALNDYNHKFKRQLFITLFSKVDQHHSFIALSEKYDSLSELAFSDGFIDKFLIEVDYMQVVKRMVSREFPSLQEIDVSNVIIRNHYEHLLEQHGINEGDLNSNVRSLLFFPGHEEEIAQAISIVCLMPQSEPANDSEEDGVFVEVSLSGLGARDGTSTGNHSKGAWLHSGIGDKEKRKSGKRAEQLVYNALRRDYGEQNVRWVSGNSDTHDKNDKLHYDITYKDQTEEWRFVEVKAVTANQFIISSEEAKYGLAFPDKYELALVTGNTIFVVKDVFIFPLGENFESNSKFSASPRDYLFTFDMNPLIRN